MVCKGSFYNFCICLSYLCKKTGFKDLPGKRALTYLKHLLPVCQILCKFAKGNARKLIVNVAFCAHFEIEKYKKH